MDDEELKAKLHAMWTPEMLENFDAMVQRLLQESPQYKDRPEEQKAMMEYIKQRAQALMRF